VILGIETSCDETAAAVVTAVGEIRSNVVSSQADIHAKYGGVVPEIASRRHLELVSPVIEEALERADCTLDDLETMAVTAGPGLIGALLVGLAAAKGIAWGRGIPLVPVNHLHGHVASLYLEPTNLEPPFTCLLASGGHTLLLDVKGHEWDEATVIGTRSIGSHVRVTRRPTASPSRGSRGSISRSRGSRPRFSTRCVISIR
jgi:N6-L-threonylcarbamoyladenine synthase